MFELVESKFYDMYFYLTDLKFKFQSMSDEEKNEMIVKWLIVLIVVVMFVMLGLFMMMK